MYSVCLKLFEWIQRKMSKFTRKLLLKNFEVLLRCNVAVVKKTQKTHVSFKIVSLKYVYSWKYWLLAGLCFKNVNVVRLLGRHFCFV